MWIDVPGYEGIYQATSNGSIRSLDRKNSIGRKTKGRVLKPAISQKGYYTVYLHKNGVGKSVLVHRIVALCFLPGFSDEYQIDHIDRNRLNCDISNLRLATQSQNMSNMVKPSAKRKYKGVTERRGRFCPAITIKKRTYHYGTYDDPIEAARVYDKHAIEFFGEYALTNEMLGRIPPVDVEKGEEECGR